MRKKVVYLYHNIKIYFKNVSKAFINLFNVIFYKDKRDYVLPRKELERFELLSNHRRVLGNTPMDKTFNENNDFLYSVKDDEYKNKKMESVVKVPKLQQNLFNIITNSISVEEKVFKTRKKRIKEKLKELRNGFN